MKHTQFSRTVSLAARASVSVSHQEIIFSYEVSCGTAFLDTLSGCLNIIQIQNTIETFARQICPWKFYPKKLVDFSQKQSIKKVFDRIYLLESTGHTHRPFPRKRATSWGCLPANNTSHNRTGTLDQELVGCCRGPQKPRRSGKISSMEAYYNLYSFLFIYDVSNFHVRLSANFSCSWETRKKTPHQRRLLK